MKLVDTNTAPSQPANQTSARQKSGAKYLVWIFVGILLVITVLVGIYFFYQRNFMDSTKNRTISKENSSTSEFLKRPIPRENSAVKSLGLLYRFNGQILEIKDSAEGKTVVTSIPHKPDFTLNPNTRINFFTNGNRSEAKVEDLKAGQNIDISAEYQIRNEEWQTRSIDILFPQNSQSTESARQN